VTKFYNISEATKLAKVSRHTILKLMNGGKLSYEVDEQGQKIIPLPDLQKIFDLPDLDQTIPTTSSSQENLSKGEKSITALMGEIAELKKSLSAKNKIITALKRDNSLLVKQLRTRQTQQQPFSPKPLNRP
jgi:hypothetical protein